MLLWNSFELFHLASRIWERMKGESEGEREGVKLGQGGFLLFWTSTDLTGPPLQSGATLYSITTWHLQHRVAHLQVATFKNSLRNMRCDPFPSTANMLPTTRKRKENFREFSPTKLSELNSLRYQTHKKAKVVFSIFLYYTSGGASGTKKTININRFSKSSNTRTRVYSVLVLCSVHCI